MLNEKLSRTCEKPPISDNFLSLKGGFVAYDDNLGADPLIKDDFSMGAGPLIKDDFSMGAGPLIKADLCRASTNEHTYFAFSIRIPYSALLILLTAPPLMLHTTVTCASSSGQIQWLARKPMSVPS